MTEHLAAPGRRSAVRATTVGVVLVFALAGCADSEPTLLEESDFEDVIESYHEQGSFVVNGGTWCELTPTLGRSAPHSTMVIGEDERIHVAAGIVWGGPYSPVEEQLEAVEDAAADCLEYAREGEHRDGLSIEPLTGLGEGVLGWRTRDGNVHYGYDDEHHERWGEWAAVPINRTVLLVVGFETDQAEAPVEIEELLQLARAGVERFEFDD